MGVDKREEKKLATWTAQHWVFYMSVILFDIFCTLLNSFLSCSLSPPTLWFFHMMLFKVITVWLKSLPRSFASLSCGFYTSPASALSSAYLLMKLENDHIGRFRCCCKYQALHKKMFSFFSRVGSRLTPVVPGHHRAARFYFYVVKRYFNYKVHLLKKYIAMSASMASRTWCRCSGVCLHEKNEKRK